MGELETDSKKGSYPGPINNFFISSFKDYWFDPLEIESTTNTYIAKNMTESTNYTIVSSKLYKVFKNNFGAINEIKRYGINYNEEVLVEVYYKQFKIILLNKGLLKKGKELIKPKYIQISKNGLFKDLKDKLRRVLFNEKIEDKEEEENEKIENGEKNSLKFEKLEQVVKIYKPNNISKSEIFELVYSYTNNFQTFNLIGEEINQDDNFLIDDLKVTNAELLIIEINEKTENDNFIQLACIHTNRKCSLCNNELNDNSNYDCTQCNNVIIINF